MPLEFLRRKGSGSPASKAAVPEPTGPPPVPEEAVAQDHQLRLTFGAKTSVGVRLQGGPQILAALPRMLDGISMTDPEVVEPRDTTLAVGVAEHHPDRGGNRVASGPRCQQPDHPPRPVRPRIARRHRPGVRHIRLRAARRRGRSAGLPGVRLGRRRRRRPLGRVDRRPDRARRRRLGRSRDPRRHRPDRDPAARPAARQHPRERRLARASPASSAPARARPGPA